MISHLELLQYYHTYITKDIHRIKYNIYNICHFIELLCNNRRFVSLQLLLILSQTDKEKIRQCFNQFTTTFYLFLIIIVYHIQH